MPPRPSGPPPSGARGTPESGSRSGATRGPARDRARRSRRLALALAVGTLSACALFEVLVRGVLLGGWFPTERALHRLRRPGSYTHVNEDLYYELRHFRRGAPWPEVPIYDPLLGWSSGRVEPLTYEHVLERSRDARRPVLFFGDSYAACNLLPIEDRFHTLFDDTRLGADMRLVDYGVASFGWDQICLLAERAVPRWLERDPLVVMSLMVDDDLDRSGLTIRFWPKQRLRPTGDGELVLEREPVPSLAAHMEHALDGPRSWAWRLVAHNVLPAALHERLLEASPEARRARQLARPLTERAVAMLREHDVDFGFLIFSNFTSVRTPEVLGWRERTVIEVLEEAGVPHVLTRVRLAERIDEEQARPGGARPPESAYYDLEGPAMNHLNARGNRVALEDLVELIERIASAP